MTKVFGRTFCLCVSGLIDPQSLRGRTVTSSNGQHSQAAARVPSSISTRLDSVRAGNIAVAVFFSRFNSSLITNQRKRDDRYRLTTWLVFLVALSLTLAGNLHAQDDGADEEHQANNTSVVHKTGNRTKSHNPTKSQPATTKAQRAKPAQTHSKGTENAFQQLDSWQVPKIFLFQDHGRVSQEKSEFVLRRGDPATGIRFSRAVLRNNYQITYEAKRVEGSDFFCGLTFPVGREHCTLILGGWGGSLVGLSNVNDEPAVENETANYISFKNDQWYRIRIRVESQRIRASVDGREVISLPRAGRRFSIWWEQEPMRPLGISTWETTGCIRHFDQQAIQ